MESDRRVCPRCGSTDIGHDTVSVLSRLSLDQSRACRDCGYTGIFPEVAAGDVDGFQDAVADRDRSAAPQPAPAFNRGRFLIGLALLGVGLPASTYATWGNGLLAGLLALAVGAAIVFEQLGRR